MNNYQLAYDQLNRAKNILLLTHQRPDGDAISSVCALTLLLDEMSNSISGDTKNYTAFCYDHPPETFNFLPNINKITNHIISKKDSFAIVTNQINKKNITSFWKFDLIIVIDCGSLNRTNLAEEIKKRKKANQIIIEFDHHKKVEDYSDIEIKKPEAASTTEILYYFLKENNLKITKDIAHCILTGILTDTANFLHPTTTQNTIDIASEMLLCGASFPKITKYTQRNKNLTSMKLWGMALNNLKIQPKYNIAFSVLTLKEMEKFGEDKDAYDGIAGFLSNIYNIAMVVFLREEKKGKIKGSLRTSRSDIDVSKLANYLGGGGHAKASGFIIEGHIQKTENSWIII